MISVKYLILFLLLTSLSAVIYFKVFYEVDQNEPDAEVPIPEEEELPVPDEIEQIMKQMKRQRLTDNGEMLYWNCIRSIYEGPARASVSEQHCAYMAYRTCMDPTFSGAMDKSLKTLCTNLAFMTCPTCLPAQIAYDAEMIKIYRECMDDRIAAGEEHSSEMMARCQALITPFGPTNVNVDPVFLEKNVSAKNETTAS